MQQKNNIILIIKTITNMKKALTVFTLCFLAVLQMNAQRSWEPLSNNDASVASETVVYGTLQDASGNQVVPAEY